MTPKSDIELKNLKINMAVKKYKPVTAGTRWRIGNAYAEVTTNEPEKSLLETKKRTGGRNSSGSSAPCVTLVAVIKRNIVLLILNEIKKILKQR